MCPRSDPVVSMHFCAKLKISFFDGISVFLNILQIMFMLGAMLVWLDKKKLPAIINTRVSLHEIKLLILVNTL